MDVRSIRASKRVYDLYSRIATMRWIDRGKVGR